jgi:putative Mn2+ efflux pump MntP
VVALLLIAGSVGLDNFAASIAIGLAGVDRSPRVRIALAFGLFEAGMPVVGMLTGRALSHSLGDQAHVVGGLLLIAVGVHTGIEGSRSEDERPAVLADDRTGGLLLVALGLSIDNLVVGFALGARGVPLAPAIAVITVVSVGLSLLGLELGSRLGERVGHRSELLGAGVLIGVGVAILANLLGGAAQGYTVCRQPSATG